MRIQNEKICECDLLKEDQEGFEKCDDFYTFKEQVGSNLLFEKLIGEKSLNFENEPANYKRESWFQCSKCRAKWCLVEPDIPYYMGNWIKATWRQ